MAFGLAGLLSFGTGGSLNSTMRRQKIWSYITADAKATLEGAGYFNSAADLLQIGDIIIAVTSYGGTEACRMYVVSDIASGVVTVIKSEVA